MQHALRRRGPDGAGTHRDGGLLLVHRRLAIIDLSDTGAQPLWNEDGTICVIANGEIYNHAELRRDLMSKGHRFRGRSDCEVLVHLYEDLGMDGCCSRIEGMFSFALWDSRGRDLYLVRDRLGIKPLVIAEHSEGVTFASTISGLIADPAVSRDLREEALVSVLKWGFVPSPWSALRAARRVMPGTWLRIREGSVAQERRWWTDVPAEGYATDAELRETIEAAVRSHLVADVPVGVLLSAGIDSGIVTALATRHAIGDPVAAWTVSHDGFVDDELPGATRAAERFGVRLHEIPLGERGLTESLFESVVGAMDEPLGVSSLVGLHAMFRAVSLERRVVLSGDGGDELFAGYNWHLGMPKVPPWARGRLFRHAARGLAVLSGAPAQLGVLGDVAAHVRRHPESVYLDKLRVASDGELRNAGLRVEGEDPIENSARDAWDRFAYAGTLEQMLAVDRATALADEMLAKVDSASMAYSVEARVPMLADKVVEMAKRLPAHRKRSNAVGKIALREWYAELADAELASRRKTGFNSPLEEWIGGVGGAFMRDRSDEALAQFGVQKARWELSARTKFGLAVLAEWRARVQDAPYILAVDDRRGM
jgi:asparagine synthase (glutamine-hydrolysing)